MEGKRKKQYQSIMSAFERSSVWMHTMPRIWFMHLKFVQTQDPCHDVTAMRCLYDHALMNLPLTRWYKLSVTSIWSYILPDFENLVFRKT